MGLGEEVKISAFNTDDGQVSVAVESDSEPGPLFEAASEAVVEVAAETPSAADLETTSPMDQSDTWRKDFEESLQSLQTETFEGRHGWADLQDYIQELQANRTQLEGTAALAWADRWENAVARPTKKDTADAAGELRGALEVSLGMRTAPNRYRNAWEMFAANQAPTGASAPKGKQGRRPKRTPKDDIMTERAGATAVVPPPVLVIK